MSVTMGKSYIVFTFSRICNKGGKVTGHMLEVYVTVEIIHEMEYNILNQAAKLYHKKRKNERPSFTKYIFQKLL